MLSASRASPKLRCAKTRFRGHRQAGPVAAGPPAHAISVVDEHRTDVRWAARRRSSRGAIPRHTRSCASAEKRRRWPTPTSSKPTTVTLCAPNSFTDCPAPRSPVGRRDERRVRGPVNRERTAKGHHPHAVASFRRRNGAEVLPCRLPGILSLPQAGRNLLVAARRARAHPPPVWMESVFFCPFLPVVRRGRTFRTPPSDPAAQSRRWVKQPANGPMNSTPNFPPAHVRAGSRGSCSTVVDGRTHKRPARLRGPSGAEGEGYPGSRSQSVNRECQSRGPDRVATLFPRRWRRDRRGSGDDPRCRHLA